LEDTNLQENNFEIKGLNKYNNESNKQFLKDNYLKKQSLNSNKDKENFRESKISKIL
jgi:hypothetical protein